MYKEIIAQTQKHVYKHWNCKCDLNLWDRGVVLSRDMSSWYAKYLCYIILKSFDT